MTTRRYYANGAPQQQLAAQITNSATSLTVTSFSGWPSQYPFFATLEIGTINAEIVSVTNIVGATATIVRGQDGTAAISHLAGATIDQTVVRQDLDEASAHTSASAGVHGVSGSVVGTSDVQTISNKTFTGTTNFAAGVFSTTVSITGALAAGVINGSGLLTLSGAGTALSVTNNATIGGTLGVTGTLTAGNLSTAGTLAVTGAASVGNLTGTGTGAFTGAVTAASFAANSNGQVTGVLNPKQYTNEAAAGTATAGLIVYLTAPTTSGYTAGLFRGNGTVWLPVDKANDTNAVQTMLFSPGAGTNSTGAGTATWLTLGNVTVPAWATSCVVSYAVNGVFDTGTTGNTSMVLKIGSASGGVSRRIITPGVASQRFNTAINDKLTGLTSGSQSVTLSATFTSGSVFTADTVSFVTVQFTFLP